MFSHCLALRNKYTNTAGFSLIELMVSIGIIVLVLSIVVTQQSTFNGAVLLRSQAYEIALDIREVQLSAVSAQSDGSGNFQTVKGLEFSKANGENQRYIPFSDSGGNANWYDSSSDTVLGAIRRLDNRFEITDISLDGTSVSSRVAITFQRPNFDALFKTSSGGALTSGIVEIDVRPRDGDLTATGCGDVRTVQVTDTGQITVLDC